MVRRKKAANGDGWLTQYGNRKRQVEGRPFKNRPPNPGQVNALSLLEGRHSVADAASLIRTSRNAASPGSGVRYKTEA